MEKQVGRMAALSVALLSLLSPTFAQSDSQSNGANASPANNQRPGPGQWRQGGGNGPAGGGPGMGQRPDFAARRQEMIKRFDTNGDGILDENEKAKMHAFMQQRRAEREAQFGGQGGGPGPGPGGRPMMRNQNQAGGQAGNAGAPGEGANN